MQPFVSLDDEALSMRDPSSPSMWMSINLIYDDDIEIEVVYSWNQNEICFNLDE